MNKTGLNPPNFNVECKKTFSSLMKIHLIQKRESKKKKKRTDQRPIPEVLRACRGLSKCNLLGQVCLMRVDSFPIAQEQYYCRCDLSN